MTQPKLIVSLDTVALLLLIPSHIREPVSSFLLVISLLVYLALELRFPLSNYGSLPDQNGKVRLAFLARLALLFVMISAAVILPVLKNVTLRITTGGDNEGYSSAYELIHDGALHTEAAVAFLMEGKNPYVERYDDTPIRFFGFDGVTLADNPSFEYLPYLPGYLFVSIPWYLAFSKLGILYDQRIVYLIAYLFLVIMLPLLGRTPVRKLLILAAVALNPLLVGPVVLGMNDVLVVLLLVVTIWLVLKKRLYWSALVVGLACATKQSAWFFLPFYFLLIAPELWSGGSMRKTLKTLGAMVIMPILLTVPFLLWDYAAFVTDVWSFPSGAVENSHPIQGYTLGNLLVGMGVIASPRDHFPFWIFQLALGAPLLLWMLKLQSRSKQVGMVFLCAGFFTFGFGFFSRFFLDNYLGYVVVLMSLGILIQPAYPMDVDRIRFHW